MALKALSQELLVFPYRVCKKLVPESDTDFCLQALIVYKMILSLY